MAQTSKQIGQRGKSEEKIVTDLLAEWNTRKNAFAFERLPDARAARGAIKAQVSDFMIGITWENGGVYRSFVLLEVKASQHEFRIAKDKLEQLPRIKKWITACADGLVLVHHTTTGLWRLIPAEHLEIGKPSWDLSQYQTYPTAEAALTSHPLFSCFKKSH